MAKKPTPAKKAAGKPATKGTSKPAAKAPAKKPEPKAAAKPVKTAKPAAKSPAPAAKKPDPKASGKPAPKVEGKVEPKAKVEVKAAEKPGAKAAAKPVEAKAGGKPAAKVEVKPSKPDAKPTADAKVAETAEAGKAGEAGKPVRKGITIVSPKPMKKPKPKQIDTEVLAQAGRLLDAKNPVVRKPLIPSGPGAARPTQLGMANPDEPVKSPFKKPELDRFRQILLQKRRELFGDVSNMEEQALQGGSGALSHLPQHLAEQGSETYEQSLQLDLAAADRKLIKEIDDALKRIDDGIYGVCELTGKPIKPERLEELPWARYSIEAAREMERRGMRAPVPGSQG